MKAKIESPFRILDASGAGGESTSIDRILQKCARAGTSEKDGSHRPILQETHGWSADFYMLQLSSAFSSSSNETQNAILRECSRKNLEEALMIEVSGMAFTAKMSLLSENLAERELYSHFAADEANHFRMIRHLVGSPRKELVDENPFLKFLGLMIQDESKASLVLLIQVILEGWGIPYYSRLAEQALHPEVAIALKTIVSDEAKHHGSGLVLFKEEKISAEDMNRLEDRMRELLGMLRMGPAGVVVSLARGLGELNRSGVETVLEETQSQKKLKSDLELIRYLLEKAGARKLSARLDSRGLFDPPSLSECSSQLSELVRKAS